MYARHTQGAKGNGEISLPGNYGGTAFRKELIPEAEKAQEPCSVEYDGEQSVSVTTLTPPQSKDFQEEAATAPAISNRLFPKEGGIGLEELLILGIILLVSQNGEKDDNLSLLLLLLLFIR